jgi:hypothetical protein
MFEIVDIRRIYGVENATNVDSRFVRRRDIRLVIRDLNAGRAWHLCHVARTIFRRKDRGEEEMLHLVLGRHGEALPQHNGLNLLFEQ